MTLARSERAALADLFADLGPDQPTLCEGWDTRDLLVHLLVRERAPLGAIGTRVPVLKGFTDTASAEFAKRPWVELVQLYRDGPPAWNPAGWGKIDEISNSGEMFIHHEDARRGQPGWHRRTFDAATTAELTRMVRSGLSKLALRKADVGVVAQLPGSEPVTLKAGTPVVTLTADPGEVLLWISGRNAVELEFAGDQNAIGRLGTLHRGL